MKTDVAKLGHKDDIISVKPATVATILSPKALPSSLLSLLARNSLRTLSSVLTSSLRLSRTQRISLPRCRV